MSIIPAASVSPLPPKWNSDTSLSREEKIRLLQIEEVITPEQAKQLKSDATAHNVLMEIIRQKHSTPEEKISWETLTQHRHYDQTIDLILLSFLKKKFPHVQLPHARANTWGLGEPLESKQRCALINCYAREALQGFIQENFPDATAPQGALEKGDVQGLHKELDRLITSKCNAEGCTLLVKHFWQETKSTLLSCSTLPHFFLETALRLRAEAQLIRCTSTPLQQVSLELFQRHAGFLSAHQTLPVLSSSRVSLHAGRMRENWLQRSTGHEFCNCHLSERPLFPDLNRKLTDLEKTQREPEQKSVAIIGCNWGGGHKSAAKSVAEACASWGYHPTTIDLPDHVLPSGDLVKKYLGWLLPGWTVAKLFNTCLALKAHSFVNFLYDFAKPKPFRSEEHQETIGLITQQLLRIQPKSVILTYSRHSDAVFEACRLLTIPCIHLTTDIDTSNPTRDRPPEYDNVRIGISYDEPQMKNPVTIQAKPEQVVVMGPPLRSEFFTATDPARIAQLRAKWQVPEGKKVVLISNGSQCAPTELPEILLRHYEKEESPYHLIVLAGDNKQYCAQLNGRSSKLSRQVMNRADATQMEELMAMASYGGALVGKAGGCTLFECMQKGLPILIDNTPGRFSWTNWFISIVNRIFKRFGYSDKLPWEEINQQFIRSHGMGAELQNTSDLVRKLNELTSHRQTPVNHGIPLIDFRERLREVMRELERP